MTSPNFNYFYRVELQVAQYTLGGIKNDRLSVRELITRTYNFVNKSLRDATTPSDRETYIPILESIGEITLSAGEILPSVSLSSITLDDSRGSFGPDRRFSDLLERFTPIDQPLIIYVGEAPNEIDAPTTWTQIGAGRIVSWSKALASDRPTMTLQIEPYRLSERVMNLEVSRDIEGMENAPQAALGKALPIVFNKVTPGATTPISRYPQVLPTRISFDGSETAKYALTTQMYQLTQARIQPNYYAKKAWEDGSNIWASISFTRAAPNYTTPLVGTYYSMFGTVSEKAHRIPQITSTNEETGFVVTGVELIAKGNSPTLGRVSGGSMTVSLLLVDRVTYDVFQTLATGTVQLNNYDDLNNAGGTFSINVSFETPTVIELTSDRSYDFYISWKGANITADDLVLQKYNETVPMLYRSAAGTQDNWGRGTSEQLVAHRLRIATATSTVHENTYTRDGYTYSSMTLSQPSPDSGQANCDLDSLEIVNMVEGFCEYPGGAKIYDPPTIVKLLSYQWDGEQWEDIDAVDVTTLETSHYDQLFKSGSGNHRARYLSGIVEAKSTYNQVISEISRGSASKIGVFSNGKLFVHPWGVNSEPTYIIPQADIIPLSWETRSDSSIVNRSQITFHRYYATNISQDEAKEGYKYSIDFSNEDYLAVQQITEQSRSLFGAKNIVDNTFNVFGFSDTNPVVGLPGYLTGGVTASQPNSGGVVIYSVDFLADYYLSRFSLPFVYCSFVVPYHRYKDIKMFDVISFHHSEFPAYFGTDPYARAGTVDDGTDVTTVVEANYGEELVRAQSYRGLVEAVSYVMAMEHAPAIRLTVQVLLNTEYDPT